MVGPQRVHRQAEGEHAEGGPERVEQQAAVGAVLGRQQGRAEGHAEPQHAPLAPEVHQHPVVERPQEHGAHAEPRLAAAVGHGREAGEGPGPAARLRVQGEDARDERDGGQSQRDDGRPLARRRHEIGAREQQAEQEARGHRVLAEGGHGGQGGEGGPPGAPAQPGGEAQRAQGAQLGGAVAAKGDQKGVLEARIDGDDDASGQRGLGRPTRAQQRGGRPGEGGDERALKAAQAHQPAQIRGQGQQRARPEPEAVAPLRVGRHPRTAAQHAHRGEELPERVGARGRARCPLNAHKGRQQGREHQGQREERPAGPTLR